jgi:hypothetical protein
MEKINNFNTFLNEVMNQNGDIDVPGESYETKVNSRNYNKVEPQLPGIIDAMYESSYFNEFLDNEGKSEEFNKFLDKEKRSGSEITTYIKDSFESKKQINNKDK